MAYNDENNDVFALGSLNENFWDKEYSYIGIKIVFLFTSWLGRFELRLI